MPRVIIMLTAVWLIHATVLAQGLPEVEKSGEQEKAVVAPEPTSLGSNWWLYFKVEGDKFERRVNETYKRLEALMKKLPAQQQEHSRAQLDRLSDNLHALSRLRGQKPSEAPGPSVVYREHYSLSEWLDLEKNHHHQMVELQEEQALLNQLASRVESADHRYDNRMAAYLEMTPTALNKVSVGLQIMADRSAVEVAKLQLQRHKKELNRLKSELKMLAAEKQVAFGRLAEEADSLKKLGQEREEMARHLAEAQIALDTARSRVLGVVAETPAARAGNRLNEQRVTLASVRSTIAQFRVALPTAKMAFVEFLTVSELDFGRVHNDLENWQKLIRNASDDAGNWRSESLREQNRAQVQLLVRPAPFPDVEAINGKRSKVAQETLLKLQELNEVRFELEVVTETLASRLAQREGMVRHWWVLTGETLTSIWESGFSWLSQSLFKIGDTPVTVLGLLRVLVIVLVAWALSGALRGVLAKIAERKEGISSALYTIGRLAHYFILLVGLMIALSSIGLDFSNLALVAGALSVGIGFGLQSIVNNFVSGLILLFERMLKVGDYLELDSGVRGVVREINVRSTLINTNDNIDIIVPNSELVGAKVTNWTLRDATRRLQVPFGVAYGTDKELVKKAALEAADRVGYTLRQNKRHNPEVWLTNFGDSSLDFQLVVWVGQAVVKRPEAVQASYLWEIESALLRHGIEIPFPQRDLHLRSVFGEKDESGKAYLRAQLASSGIQI